VIPQDILPPQIPPSSLEGISNKEIVMRKVTMLGAAMLLMTGTMAACSEQVTRSEKNIQEKNTYSSTTQDNRGLADEQRRDSAIVEQRQQTMTSDGMGENTTTREKSTMEKRRSETMSPSSVEDSLGANQEYHQQSETFRQHSTTEVTK
jgi:hypothetical protein